MLKHFLSDRLYKWISEWVELSTLWTGVNSYIVKSFIFVCLGYHRQFSQSYHKGSHNTLSDTSETRRSGGLSILTEVSRKPERTQCSKERNLKWLREIVQETCTHVASHVYRACNLMETWVPLDQEQIISTEHKVLLPAQQNNRLVANYGSSQADVPLVFKTRHRALVCYNYYFHVIAFSVYNILFWCYHISIN